MQLSVAVPDEFTGGVNVTVAVADATATRRVTAHARIVRAMHPPRVDAVAEPRLSAIGPLRARRHRRPTKAGNNGSAMDSIIPRGGKIEVTS
jgi:hypothetical protein